MGPWLRVLGTDLRVDFISCNICRCSIQISSTFMAKVTRSKDWCRYQEQIPHSAGQVCHNRVYKSAENKFKMPNQELRKRPEVASGVTVTVLAATEGGPSLEAPPAKAAPAAAP